jgi:hypothetical protein
MLDIDKARAVRIEDVIAERNIKLSPGRVERCGPCPSCGGTDRFSINVRKQVFNCRGCGSKGDVIALVQTLDGVDFTAAVETLAGAAPKPNGESTRTLYEYRDASGEVRYRKTRLDYTDGGKAFYFENPSRNNGPPLLYGGERLVDLSEGQPVWIVEGERKCDRLRELGVVAVSGDSGAKSKWTREHAELLRGLRIIFWPDSDKPGEKYISNAAGAIRGVNPAADIRVVRPFGPPSGEKGKDVCNWSGNADDLIELAAGAKAYEPAASSNGADADYVPPGEPSNGPFTRKVKRGGDFLAEYTPIIYAIDGVLPSGAIYGLTAKHGGGKTALAIALTLSCITGKNLIEFEVEQGRVAYVVLENPADFRMKLAANCYVHGVDWTMLNKGLTVLDMRLPHAEVMEQLRTDAEENGPFRLALYDTFQGGFSGAQFNANEDVLKHAIELRQLTTLPGAPGVIVLAHPVKNAQQDNLVPYGGGATMNELDGNLWLWNEGSRIEFGWNKVRGPEPEKRFFSIEKLGSPDILDSKGRQPLLPVIRAMSAETVDQRNQDDANTGLALLRAIIAEPHATQEKWGKAIGRDKSRVNRKLQQLRQRKLVDEGLGKWRVTPKGIKEVNL